MLAKCRAAAHLHLERTRTALRCQIAAPSGECNHERQGFQGSDRHARSGPSPRRRVPPATVQRRDLRIAARRAAKLITDQTDFLANISNFAALLFSRLPNLNWAGFYLLRGSDLVLGPFQGKPACSCIAMGDGVCGTAALQRAAVLVPDVHAFPGHIVCDEASQSEMVLPVFKGEPAHRRARSGQPTAGPVRRHRSRADRSAAAHADGRHRGARSSGSRRPTSATGGAAFSRWPTRQRGRARRCGAQRPPPAAGAGAGKLPSYQRRNASAGNGGLMK